MVGSEVLGLFAWSPSVPVRSTIGSSQQVASGNNCRRRRGNPKAYERKGCEAGFCTPSSSRLLTAMCLKRAPGFPRLSCAFKLQYFGCFPVEQGKVARYAILNFFETLGKNTVVIPTSYMPLVGTPWHPTNEGSFGRGSARLGRLLSRPRLAGNMRQQAEAEDSSASNAPPLSPRRM